MTTAPIDNNNNFVWEAAAAHSAVTLELAQKESAEQLHGMQEVYDEMRTRPLIVKAYAMDDPKAPQEDKDDDINAVLASRSNIKTVHFVRHGQGFHNLMADLARAQGREWVQFSKSPENPYTMPELLDAPLTEKGRQQAIALQPRVAALKNPPELIVCSPLCRALQTGIIVFANSAMENNNKAPNRLLAHEMVREQTGIHVCDKRRAVSRQKLEFPLVDFSLLDSSVCGSGDDDPIFRDHVRESKQELGERIYNFMEWLSRREEKHISVNTHSGWLLTLFNGILQCEDSSLKAWFQTGEMRSVKLLFVHSLEASCSAVKR
jgi:broad specificity phosphatase PhoE